MKSVLFSVKSYYHIDGGFPGSGMKQSQPAPRAAPFYNAITTTDLVFDRDRTVRSYSAAKRLGFVPALLRSPNNLP
jgi:hypothetical protein